jgi:ATP-dependent DNA helicase RecG
MVHPRARSVLKGASLPEALTPVYPTTAGLSQLMLRKLIGAALGRANLDDTLPDDVRVAHQLMPFDAAIRMLHLPPAGLTPEALEQRNRDAWRRIRFDEVLAQQISLRRAYAARRARTAPALRVHGTLTGQLLARLSFRLTGAQQRTWREIASDLAQVHPMQRLLQGDVGSGKTIVAALALLQAVENGWQGALMAPTEILAEQHWRKLSAWLGPLGVEVAWLSGSLKKKEKLTMLAAVREGRAAIAVGTHALIEDAVDFERLGLAVVDEQHRFGVHQRLALRQKGGTGATPHQLMMSATPIPRTLAMSYYADLDVSVIDELPPGRMPVLTKLVSEARRDEVVARIRDACAQGRQAYWVCPLIEESETLQLNTALETYARLYAELPDLTVGLVHGRLKAAEKAEVMAAFVAGDVQVLVATTVIEVGVDVPNASLMVIEHAERFGLSQLHQLRGRVGRGAAESACILLYAQRPGEIARARLKIIFENSDGFEIARQDLHLRGPGEFVGARQSGVPLLRYADLEDDAMVETARAVAESMLGAHPQAAETHLARWLSGREELLKA